jgi:hypothetical protein
MADPTKYTKGYSFEGYQANNPSKPLPAPRLDDELENISTSIDETIDALKDIRRADGALKNGIVTADAMAPEVSTDILANAVRAEAAADAAEASQGAAASFATAAAASATAAHASEVYAEDQREAAEYAAERALENATLRATASQAEAEAGVVNDKGMTPLRTRQAIAVATAVHVDNFGAIGDGASHPLSEVFASLADARLVYPHATALSDEVDWCAIQAAVNAALPRALVQLAAKTYVINQPINANSRALTGASASLFGGTVIKRSADIVMWQQTGAKYNYQDFGGLSRITFADAEIRASDFIQMAYSYGGTMSDVLITGITSGGAGLRLTACQDINFWRLFIRGPGYQNICGALELSPGDATDIDIQNNDLRFVACHFEHLGGTHPTLLRSMNDASAPGRNNSIRFMGCKFEQGGSAYPLVALKNVSRFTFDSSCVYTSYSLAFYIVACDNISVRGKALNSSSPTAFTDTSASTLIEVDVRGTYVGTVVQYGNSRSTFFAESPGNYVVASKKHSRLSVLDDENYLAYHGSTLDGRTLVSDAESISGTALRGNGLTGEPVLAVRYAPAPSRNGATLWVRAKSTAEHGYDFRVFAGGVETTITSPTITTVSLWYRLPVPANFLKYSDFEARVCNGAAMGSTRLTIVAFYWEDIFVSGNVPPSVGTWEVGALVRREMYAPGRATHAMCTVGGTPGTWLPVGIVPGVQLVGDAGASWTHGGGATTLLFTTALTAARTVNLQTASISDGAEVLVSRPASGAFPLLVRNSGNTITYVTLASGTWARIVYSSAVGDFVVAASGAI